MHFANAVSAQVMQNNSDLAELKETVRLMDRKLSKMQSRVLLCTEQLKTVRKLATETSSLATGTLTEHATTLTEVQEQTNSLQQIMSSLQDVVVKQLEVCALCCSGTLGRVLFLGHVSPVLLLSICVGTSRRNGLSML